MLRHPAFEPENAVFGEIGGEVCDAFKIFRDPQDINAVAYDGRMLGHWRKGDNRPLLACYVSVADKLYKCERGFV